MCGRYVLAQPVEQVAEYFGATVAPALEQAYAPSYNVAPTDNVIGLAPLPSGERVLRGYRWGLVPSWATDPSIGNRLFNARAETVASRPAFRSAFRSRRIAVVADGYYEWKKGPSNRRQPYYFQRADGAPMAFAGLWEPWRKPGGPEEGEWLRTCTIITADAASDVAAIHDRMPAILEAGALEIWLDPTAEDEEELEALLAPGPTGTLRYYPVGRQVGNVRNNDPELLAKVEIADS